MTHPAKVGFIGLGDMGGPIAANLLRSGVPLMTRKSTRRLVRRSGLEAAAANGDFLACNLVFLCLPGTEAVRDTLFGTDGLLDTMPTASTVVDLGTTSYSGTLEIAERLQAKEITFVDAPISGMQARAEAGTTRTYQQALLKGLGSLDKGAMIKVFEDLLNVQVRVNNSANNR